MAVRVGDIGVTIDFDVGEDISSASAMTLICKAGLHRKVFTGILSGTQIVRYVTAAATDFPVAGNWNVQAHVVQTGKDRHSVADTLEVIEAL